MVPGFGVLIFFLLWIITRVSQKIQVTHPRSHAISQRFWASGEPGVSRLMTGHPRQLQFCLKAFIETYRGCVGKSLVWGGGEWEWTHNTKYGEAKNRNLKSTPDKPTAYYEDIKHWYRGHLLSYYPQWERLLVKTILRLNLTGMKWFDDL